MARPPVFPTAIKSLIADLRGILKREPADRLMMLKTWVAAGKILDDLRQRHLAGEFRKLSWANLCDRHCGLKRVTADQYIDAYHHSTNDSELFAWFAELLEFQQASQSKPDKTKKTIFIKRPGVIFGYLTELDEQGKREFFALCWRNYPKMMRDVGDSMGDPDDETRATASPLS